MWTIDLPSCAHSAVQRTVEHLYTGAFNPGDDVSECLHLLQSADLARMRLSVMRSQSVNARDDVCECLLPFEASWSISAGYLRFPRPSPLSIYARCPLVVCLLGRVCCLPRRAPCHFRNP
eukprot:77904-Rhodomonas_salina.3